MNTRGSTGLWIFGIVIVVLALVGSYFFATGRLFDIGSNERTIMVDGVKVTYAAMPSWGHSGYPCNVNDNVRDVLITDESGNGTMKITGSAPNTGGRSCSTYNVGATATVTFDPVTMQRMVITTSRSITCDANKPTVTTSVNQLTQTKTLPGDGSVKATGGEIIINNNGAAITIDTTEGRDAISDLINPLPVAMSVSGGNGAASRMYGCTLSMSITDISVTPTTTQPTPTGTTPTKNNTASTDPATSTDHESWWDKLWQNLKEWWTWTREAMT